MGQRDGVVLKGAGEAAVIVGALIERARGEEGARRETISDGAKPVDLEGLGRRWAPEDTLPVALVRGDDDLAKHLLDVRGDRNGVAWKPEDDVKQALLDPWAEVRVGQIEALEMRPVNVFQGHVG